MDYASSYATGLSRHDGARAGADATPATGVLPPPKPNRLHWSTLFMVAGLAVCFVGLLATIAGVPASMGYDVDGAPNRNKPNSSDPLKITQSLDGNMKWIDANSSDAEGAYVGYIKSINRSEAAIPAMVSALVSMDAAVRAIDVGIGDVGATTTQMGADMQAMLTTSTASAGKMSGLGGDIGFLSRSMLSLAGSTQQLTARMKAIESKAGAIAKNGTSVARATTEELNGALPENVPTPVLSGGKAAGGGTNASAATASQYAPGEGPDAAPGDVHAAGMPPVIGAQPARPRAGVTP